jgi:hypothetical protein
VNDTRVVFAGRVSEVATFAASFGSLLVVVIAIWVAGSVTRG